MKIFWYAAGSSFLPGCLQPCQASRCPSIPFHQDLLQGEISKYLRFGVILRIDCSNHYFARPSSGLLQDFNNPEARRHSALPIKSFALCARTGSFELLFKTGSEMQRNPCVFSLPKCCEDNDVTAYGSSCTDFSNAGSRKGWHLIIVCSSADCLDASHAP